MKTSIISILCIVLFQHSNAIAFSGNVHADTMLLQNELPERERKNMVKWMALPLVLWNSVSLGYERQVSYRSGIHFSSTIGTTLEMSLFSPEGDGSLGPRIFTLNSEYRYYLRTENSRFFYNFFPFGFITYLNVWDDEISEDIVFSGIGVGRLFKINSNLYLDIGIGGILIGYYDSNISYIGALKPTFSFSYNF